MKCSRNFLGQHIGYYSRVIHTCFWPMKSRLPPTFWIAHLNRLLAFFFSANANGVLDRTHEDFSITNLARLGGFDDGFHSRTHLRVRQNDFNFYLGKKIHRVFTTAINLCVAFLAPKAFYLGNSHPFDTHARQSFFHIFEFEGFDDSLDFFM